MSDFRESPERTACCCPYVSVCGCLTSGNLLKEPPVVVHMSVYVGVWLQGISWKNRLLLSICQCMWVSDFREYPERTACCCPYVSVCGCLTSVNLLKEPPVVDHMSVYVGVRLQGISWKNHLLLIIIMSVYVGVWLQGISWKNHLLLTICQCMWVSDFRKSPEITAYCWPYVRVCGCLTSGNILKEPPVVGHMSGYVGVWLHWISWKNCLLLSICQCMWVSDFSESPERTACCWSYVSACGCLTSGNILKEPPVVDHMSVYVGVWLQGISWTNHLLLTICQCIWVSDFSESPERTTCCWPYVSVCGCLTSVNLLKELPVVDHMSVRVGVWVQWISWKSHLLLTLCQCVWVSDFRESPERTTCYWPYVSVCGCLTSGNLQKEPPVVHNYVSVCGCLTSGNLLKEPPVVVHMSVYVGVWLQGISWKNRLLLSICQCMWVSDFRESPERTTCYWPYVSVCGCLTSGNLQKEPPVVVHNYVSVCGCLTSGNLLKEPPVVVHMSVYVGVWLQGISWKNRLLLSICQCMWVSDFRECTERTTCCWPYVSVYGCQTSGNLLKEPPVVVHMSVYVGVRLQWISWKNRLLLIICQCMWVSDFRESPERTTCCWS